MPSRKITLSSVKDLGAGETIWDSETKGFGCRRQVGEDRVFIVKYRHGKGRTARQYLFTIGKLGSPWTPDSARNEAKRVLGRVACGENPAAARQQEKIASTVNEAFDLFMQDNKGKRGERTQEEYRRQYDRMAKGTIGKHRVQDVIRADITKLHSSFSDTPTGANRLLQVLSSFFGWCERQGYRPEGTNPCRHIAKYKEKSRERFLSEKELFALSEALREYDREYGHIKEQAHKKNKTGETVENAVTLYATAALRLLVFTGARCGEILNLKWTDVDFKNRLIRLQESKTGQKTIYLSASSLQILSEIPRIKGNPYVIAGAKEKTRLVNIKDPWQRVKKMTTINLWREDKTLAALIKEEEKNLPQDHRTDDLFAAIQLRARNEKIDLPTGFTDVRIHDLRHNFASIAVATGHHLKVVGSLLGHAKTSTTERYAHLANDPLQTAAETISKRLMDAMTQRQRQDNIVNIHK